MFLKQILFSTLAHLVENTKYEIPCGCFPPEPLNVSARLTARCDHTATHFLFLFLLRYFTISAQVSVRVSRRRPQSALAPRGDRLLLQGPTRKIMPSSPPTSLISHPAPPLGCGRKCRKEATHAPTHTTHVCSKETFRRVRAKREAEFLFTGHEVSGTLVLVLLAFRNCKVNVRTS